MADLGRVRSNVKRMVDQSAPEEDIDDYLRSENVTAAELRGGDTGTADRTLRRTVNTFSLGLGNIPLDAFTAAANVALGRNDGEGFTDEYRRQRRKTRQAIEPSLSPLDIAADTAGYTGQAIASLPLMAGRGVAALTRAEIGRESGRFGAAFGYGGGYTAAPEDAGAAETIGTQIKHGLAGYALGRVIPGAINLASDYVAQPIRNALMARRAATAQRAGGVAADYAAAGVGEPPPFMMGGPTAQGTASGLSGTVFGSSIRAPARASIEAIETQVRREIAAAGGEATPAEVGERVQALLRRNLEERTTPKDVVEQMSPLELQDISGVKPSPDYQPAPPKVDPTLPQPVERVTPEGYLKQIESGVPEVPPRPVESLGGKYVEPKLEDVPLSPELAGRVRAASDRASGELTRYNQQITALRQHEEQLTERMRQVGLSDISWQKKTGDTPGHYLVTDAEGRVHRVDWRGNPLADKRAQAARESLRSAEAEFAEAQSAYDAAAAIRDRELAKNRPRLEQTQAAYDSVRARATRTQRLLSGGGESEAERYARFALEGARAAERSINDRFHNFEFALQKAKDRLTTLRGQVSPELSLEQQGEIVGIIQHLGRQPQLRKQLEGAQARVAEMSKERESVRTEADAYREERLPALIEQRQREALQIAEQEAAREAALATQRARGEAVERARPAATLEAGRRNQQAEAQARAAAESETRTRQQLSDAQFEAELARRRGEGSEPYTPPRRGQESYVTEFDAAYAAARAQAPPVQGNLLGRKGKEFRIPPPKLGNRYDDAETEAITEMWRFAKGAMQGKPPERLSDWLIRRGGLSDQSTDVRHIMGEAKQRPALINRNGATLDDAALAAQEAGFFQPGERPTPNDLLNALQDDLRGDFFVREADRVLLEDRAAAQQMAEELNRLGVWKTRDERQVAKILGREKVELPGGPIEGGVAATKTNTSKLLDSIALEARSKGQMRGYKAGELFDESGALRPEIADYLRPRLGDEVTDMLVYMGEHRARNLFTPAVQGKQNIRTAIGRAIDDPALDTTSLQRLYRAVDQDIEAFTTGAGAKGAQYRQQREAVDAAYKDFMENVKTPLNKVFPENVDPVTALARLTKATRKSEAIEPLRAFYRVVEDKGDRAVATSWLLNDMTQDGLAGFLKAYRGLSEDARQLMFKDATKALGEKLDALARIGGPLERFLKTAGDDASIDLTKLARPGNLFAAMLGYISLPALIKGAIGAEMAARLLSSQRYAKWLRTVPVEKGPRSIEWQRHMNRLRALAVEELGVNEAVGTALIESVMGSAQAGPPVPALTAEKAPQGDLLKRQYDEEAAEERAVENSGRVGQFSRRLVPREESENIERHAPPGRKVPIVMRGQRFSSGSSGSPWMDQLPRQPRDFPSRDEITDEGRRKGDRRMPRAPYRDWPENGVVDEDVLPELLDEARRVSRGARNRLLERR